MGVSIETTAEKEAEQIKIEAEANKVNIIEQEKFRGIVKQLGHDINAPISSLNNMLRKLGNIIPENERITLRNASERIAGISQKLQNQYNKSVDKNDNEIFIVSLALMQIVNERREDHRKTGVVIEIDIDETANFSCIKHSSGAFKRMISNLIKNAVEALSAQPSGKVMIYLGVFANKVAIIIKDNGPGMPQHIQDKFKEGIEVTEGKEGGHGIGLTQVRDAIKAGGGKYKIYADEDGTKITIWFPIVTIPEWVATEIKLNIDDTVVILDDDESIHGSWNSNFKEVIEKYPTLKIEHYSQGIDVVNFINSLTPEQKQNVFLLTDFELLDQNINGMEVVAQTNMRRAILVTSYSAHPEMQIDVGKAGIKMLPKELAYAAQIKVDKKIPKWSSKADMVWVEDQDWLVDDIVKRYYGHLEVDIYYDPISFMEDVHQYPLDTRIILDNNYVSKNEILYTVTGYDIARELHAIGYTKLIIYTGEDPGDKAPAYLQVVRKRELGADANMDKI